MPLPPTPEPLVQAVLSEQSHAEQPNYLRLPLAGAISTLDPGKTQFRDAIELVEQLFLGLTDFNPDTYQVVPELAIDWTVDDTGTLYTFRLRQDVQWTDGTPVTAYDIVWAIQRNLRPETDAPYVNRLFLLENAKQYHEGEIKDVKFIGVKALDDYTVQFTLEHPASYFPALAGLWMYRPLPRKVIEQYPEQWTAIEYIQTNGAYKVKIWEKANVLILAKNPDYYAAETVNIPAIHYSIIPTSALGLAMYKNNELDVLGEMYLRIPHSDLLRVKNSPELREDLRTNRIFCTDFYGFNNSIAPTNERLVRKALAAAIDKKMLINFVFKGQNEVANTLVRTPILGAVPPETGLGIAFNPTQAQRWLSEAGYPNGKNFPTLHLLYKQSEANSDVAMSVQAMLRQYLNIELTINAQPLDEYLTTLAAKRDTIHLYHLRGCADYPDANSLLYEAFHPKKSTNYINWNNKEFSEVVEKAQRLRDPEARKALYYRAEQILNEEEAAILPIFFATATYLVKPHVKNWYGMAFGGQHIRDFTIIYETPR